MRTTLPFALALLTAIAAADEESKPVHLVGDETPSVKVKAEPKNYFDRPFVMTGGIEVSDYYNFGYLDADKSHYSLDFVEVLSESPQKTGETCHLYLKRSEVSKLIVDKILTANTDKKLRRIRVKAQIDSRRYEGSWNTLELVDVQFATADLKGWEPWFTDSIREKERKEAEVAKKLADEEKAKLVAQKQKLEAERRAARTRTWTSGRFSVTAEYAGLVSGKVRLKKADGEVIKVDLDKLSDADRKWIAELGK